MYIDIKTSCCTPEIHASFINSEVCDMSDQQLYLDTVTSSMAEMTLLPGWAQPAKGQVGVASWFLETSPQAVRKPGSHTEEDEARPPAQLSPG